MKKLSFLLLAAVAVMTFDASAQKKSDDPVGVLT